MSFVAGLGLLAFAIEYHFEMVGESCEGCAPFHPLFVIAPMVLGAILTLGGAYVVRRQQSSPAISSNG